MNEKDKNFLSKLFFTAISAADPENVIRENLPSKPKGRTVVIGAGKGVAQLACAFEKFWESPVTGTVVTRYGFATKCKNIKVLEASHPVPDQAGIVATTELFSAVQGLTSDDLVVAIFCGGGSALLPAPPVGFSLEDEQKLNSILLNSGAPISVLNAIRKRFSQVKGGQLAVAASPAQVVSLIVSDVPGDDPAQVASGPTVPDTTTQDEAIAGINAFDIQLPEKILAQISDSQFTTPDPDSSEFQDNEVKIIASSAMSLDATAKYSQSMGIPAVVLSDRIEGESCEVAKVHAAIAREVNRNNQPFLKPIVMLSGGETTVTINGNGIGGPNTEFMLSLGIALDGVKKVCALAADTDGIDGTETNAGAFVCGNSALRLRKKGINPANYLKNNDSWTAFNAIGDLFVTGPTGTNVNDFRAIYIQ